MPTKFRQSLGHDRMTLKATFPNQDEFNFNISRSRDSYSARQLKSVEPVTQAEFGIITKWCRCGESETHVQRYERFRKLAEKAGSLEGLAMLISAGIT